MNMGMLTDIFLQIFYSFLLEILIRVDLGMHTCTRIFAETTCNPDMHLQLSLVSCTTDLSPDLGQLFRGI